MEGYLVEFFLKGNKVGERICKSSTVFNATSTAVRAVSENNTIKDFDSIKAHKVKLSYEIINE